MNGCVKGGIRGALIVFEGCDRSGKSTQCAKLAEKLIADGKKVKLMKFPDRTTPIGQMIDRYLKQTEELDDHTIHLLFSSNRWEAMQKMVNLLKSGTTLIVDRYAYSGVAYSAAKGLSIDWCRQSDVGLVKPDKVIYISVSSEKAAERSQYGIERYEKQEFQQKVNNIFLQLQDPSYWQTVNGDASIDALHNEVYNITTEVIKISERLPLLQLWKDETIPNNSNK
uniref:Thymidylate kinase n=1 Tax=Arion vulgaris TaxID=1028688 RepID=A0A0B6YQ72_9EUPU